MPFIEVYIVKLKIQYIQLIQIPGCPLQPVIFSNHKI